MQMIIDGIIVFLIFKLTGINLSRHLHKYSSYEEFESQIKKYERLQILVMTVIVAIYSIIISNTM